MSTDNLYKQFRLVFEQYYNPLCKYAYGYIRDKEVCEDIVQDVFIKIWESHRDILLIQGIKYYLFTAVRNNCLTYIKREQRIPVYSLTNIDVEEELSAAGTDSTEGDQVNYKELLNKGIEQLPLKCKEVFLLSRLGNFSNQDVANNLGISIKTVNNQIWKALKLLRASVKSG
ncbi:MAG: RNA polymerase sigma-70 factor [Chitinophaga sp.]|uniref:RNA polymerase sigma-70 factor n=1 Tax=Chitinophaga sp. TaxID=1869181 RepID=UPI001B0DBE91|nr:RNA polymerase sigma-70 factor [Chitinophaga sp.]MBO9729816.1 RNA polymerase sigma-70 factor [Chitinophaga sp.]